MYFQNSIDYHNYINEYQELVYQYYSKEYVSYQVIYYNIDKDESIIDKDILEGGSYSLVGELSGWKWKKIYFLPVFFIEPITNLTYESTERGLIQEAETSFVFPSSYGITPNEQDLVYFPTILNPKDDQNNPIFIIKSIEEDIIARVHFYKCTCNILKYDRKDIDKQVSKSYIFVDYLKRIYPIDIGKSLIELINNLPILTHNLHKHYIKELDLLVG